VGTQLTQWEQRSEWFGCTDYRPERVVCPTMTERPTVAGVPHDVGFATGFATQTGRAQSLITEAVNASVPASWVAWDEVLVPLAPC
jgi:hypothetical protein